MAGDPEGVIRFEAAGKRFTAVFGFRAMKAVETHYDLPFLRAIQSAMPELSAEDMADKAKVAAASADIRFSDIGHLLEFALLKHHPDVTAADIEEIVDDIGLSRVSEVIGDALAAALVEEGGDSPAGNPPRGSRKKSTGSRS